MKKNILASLLVCAAATGAYGQGQFTADNLGANANASSTATSGGLFYSGLTDATATVYNGASLNIEILAGASATSLSPIVTLTGANGFVNGGAPGEFADASGSVYTVAGVPAGSDAFVEVEVWEGTAATYAAAQAAGGYTGNSGVFQNALGGPATPPVPPTDLTGMPSVILTPTPEPSTLALGGLGAAALLLFRRRK